MEDYEIYFLIYVGLNILVTLILLLMNISNKNKIKILKNKYNRFMGGLGDKNIEELLQSCIDRVKDVEVKNSELQNDVSLLNKNLMQCVQKVGVVRYNAFENVGSDLSYSIALLDYYDNGVVLSSLYSRDGSSTYAKPVSDGKSSYSLSEEEIQAIEIARKQHSKLYFEKD